MKNFAFIIVFLFSSISFANAQSTSQIAVNVPFDFYIQNQKLTAGNYLIESVSPQSNQPLLVFRGKSGKVGLILMMNPTKLKSGNKSSKISVVFNRYGEEYFLTEIRNTSAAIAFTINANKTEKLLA